MSTSHAILLTAPGSAAIAVIRLSGDGVGRFLERHLSRPPMAGRLTHGLLRDLSGNVLDDPIVARLSEAAADLSVHASPWIVRQVFEMARQEGFRTDEASSFPLDRSAIDELSQQSEGDPLIHGEMLTHLPLAGTELAVRALLAQPAAWERWGRLEPSARQQHLRRMLEDRALWWLLHPPRVAIVGAANVGKSTLANQLFAQERSIVADQPGTTRDWVGELANINGLAVMLVDTPGRRQTDDPIERQAIQQSGSVVDSADLVVEVLDASADQDSSAVPSHVGAAARVVRVANKQDLCAWAAQPAGVLPLTATTGEGMDDLRRAITRNFGCDQLDAHLPRWWTARQRALIEEQALALDGMDS